MGFLYYSDLEAARKAAAAEVETETHYHVFIFLQTEGEHKGGFGILWHSENRYVFAYLPDGAQLVLHGEVNFQDNADRSSYRKVITWSPRGNVDAEETYVLIKALGFEKAVALVQQINDPAQRKES